MYHIPLNSYLYDLSIDMKYVKAIWTNTMWLLPKFENLIFFIHFLNKDISFNIPSTFLNLLIHVDESHLEGSVSQIFDLGPRFYFM